MSSLKCGASESSSGLYSGAVRVERATNRGIRLRNRSALLTRLFLDGPLTRQELARRTGLSQPAVSNVVGDLIDAGLISEAGASESGGGRPGTLLRVAPDYGSVVGVDVGETRVRVELFSLGREPLARVDRPIGRSAPPAAVVAAIAAGLLAVAATGPAVLGVGVGVAGIVQQGAIVDAQTLGWEAVPLRRMLEEVTALPLHIDNGAKTLGQAEMWFGAGRGSRHAVFALIGSGVGAAVVTDGVTYRGTSSSAGEWGHTTLVYGGRECRCGARGCLEAYVGAGAILDRSGLDWDPADEESALARVAGLPSARTVLGETADYLGAGVANLINLFNPELVVLGGWAAVILGESLLPRVRASAARHALRQPFGQARIELGELGEDAVALGAATLPLAQFLLAGGVR